MSFSIQARDPRGAARAGLLRTARGALETPVFLPVATQAAVKALSQDDLDSLGVRGLLANAYHLTLRPGADVIAGAGGLHAFMSYPGTLLTDSGGFQVMSLAPLRKVEEEGITFKSHLDGSMHRLSPEGVIDVQSRLGSDIWTTLDVCVPHPCPADRAREAMETTSRWARRGREAFLRRARGNGDGPLFFPILQGSFYPELRRQAAERCLELDPDGISLGGFSVGEPKALTWETLSGTTASLPEEKPRYLMGMGTQEDLWEAVHRGVDMMDCVWPTRLARHGSAMLRSGRVNLGRSSCRADRSPLDPDCVCRVCRRHSRAYLAHLFRSDEMTASSLLAYHNVHTLMALMREIRRSILQGRFHEERLRFFEETLARRRESMLYTPDTGAAPRGP